MGVPNGRLVASDFSCFASLNSATLVCMNSWKNDFLAWLKVFVPCFVVFNMLAEVALALVPKTQHSAVGLSWIASGVAMMLWGHFGDWGGH